MRYIEMIHEFIEKLTMAIVPYGILALVVLVIYVSVVDKPAYVYCETDAAGEVFNGMVEDYYYGDNYVRLTVADGEKYVLQRANCQITDKE